MKRYKLKKSALVGLYALAFLVLMGSIIVVDKSLNSKKTSNTPDYDYINKTGLDDEIPVVGENVTIIKPYKDNKITVLKGFYNYKGNEEEQKNSLLYYDSTYLQNTAVAYGGVESFDVNAISDGTVVSVREDEILGSIIEIEHANKVISVYQSVSDVRVKQNDIVKQGDVIAKSGKSNINKNLNSHLLFELIINGQIVNPEEYYNKKLSEL